MCVSLRVCSSEAEKILEALATARPNSQELGWLVRRIDQCRAMAKLADSKVLDLVALEQEELDKTVSALEDHWAAMPEDLQSKCNVTYHVRWMDSLADMESADMKQRVETLVDAVIPGLFQPEWSGKDFCNGSILQSLAMKMEACCEKYAMQDDADKQLEMTNEMARLHQSFQAGIQ